MQNPIMLKHHHCRREKRFFCISSHRPGWSFVLEEQVKILHCLIAWATYIELFRQNLSLHSLLIIYCLYYDDLYQDVEHLRGVCTDNGTNFLSRKFLLNKIHLERMIRNIQSNELLESLFLLDLSGREDSHYVLSIEYS